MKPEPEAEVRIALEAMRRANERPRDASFPWAVDAEYLVRAAQQAVLDYRASRNEVVG